MAEKKDKFKAESSDLTIYRVCHRQHIEDAYVVCEKIGVIKSFFSSNLFTDNQGQVHEARRHPFPKCTTGGPQLGIHGFDYSRTKKWGKTANSIGNFINLILKWRFLYSQIQIFQEHNPRE